MKTRRVIDDHPRAISIANRQVRVVGLLFVVFGLVFTGLGVLFLFSEERRSFASFMGPGVLFLAWGIFRMRQQAPYPED